MIYDARCPVCVRTIQLVSYREETLRTGQCSVFPYTCIAFAYLSCFFWLDFCHYVVVERTGGQSPTVQLHAWPEGKEVFQGKGLGLDSCSFLL